MSRSNDLLSSLALVFTLVLSSCCTTGSKTGPVSSGTHSVAHFAAKGDGKTDDTSAFQAAIDDAAQTGGPVEVPPGKYLIAGSLRIRSGVALAGANVSPQSISPLSGTVILATGGRDNEDAPALFEMERSTAVTGITVYYPGQKPRDIHAYPWTFRAFGDDCTIENVTLINSYNGIRLGPENNTRHRIRSVVGCVLRRGIYVDYCTDIGRIENVQFHCHWWSDPGSGGEWTPVFDYMVANLEAFVFARTDWEYVTNTFVFPAKIGYRFIESANGKCNGQFSGIGADATETAIQVDAVQELGLQITNGEFVSFTGVDPVQVRINDTCKGNVRFVNCAFWGPSAQIARINGKGATSFGDCSFWDTRATLQQSPTIQVGSGRVQITHSTFSLPLPPFPQMPQPNVELGDGVVHAIIQGNNGTLGVRVRDLTDGKAIVSDNEAPIVPPVDAPAALR